MTHEARAIAELPPSRRDILRKSYDVGAAGNMTGEEIIQALFANVIAIKEKFRDGWIDRVREDATLVWQIAAEAKCKAADGDPKGGGWANAFYCKEKGIKTKSARPGRGRSA